MNVIYTKIRGFKSARCLGNSMSVTITNRTLLILLGLAFLSLLPNLGVYEYKGEEPLRTIVAWEMFQSGDYLQPTFFGEDYFRKPPLFTWLTVAAASITGWNELAARSLSIISYLVTVLFVYLFSNALFQNRKLSLLASLVYATTAQTLFVYGFIGEIDNTFTVFVFGTMAFSILAFQQQRYLWLWLAGICSGLAFMLKGLPAWLFLGVTVLTLIYFYRAFRFTVLLNSGLAGTIAIAVPLSWALSSADISEAANVLFSESANRSDGSIKKTITHLFEFPLKNFLKGLPGSLFFIIPIIAWVQLNSVKQLPNRFRALPVLIKAMIVILCINYIPYWIASGAKMRYVLPMVPVFAVLVAYVLTNHAKPSLTKYFVYTAAAFIGLRLIFGVVAIPIMMEERPLLNSDKKIAQKLTPYVQQDSVVACDCDRRKAVCLYISTEYNKVLKTPAMDSSWDFYITCDKQEGLKVVEEFIEEKDPVYFYGR